MPSSASFDIMGYFDRIVHFTPKPFFTPKSLKECALIPTSQFQHCFILNGEVKCLLSLALPNSDYNQPYPYQVHLFDNAYLAKSTVSWHSDSHWKTTFRNIRRCCQWPNNNNRTSDKHHFEFYLCRRCSRPFWTKKSRGGDNGNMEQTNNKGSTPSTSFRFDHNPPK